MTFASSPRLIPISALAALRYHDNHGPGASSSLRHAFASHALEGKADLVVLKAVLGHARMKSTYIYLHPSMRLLREAINDHLASEILGDLVTEEILVLRVHQKWEENPAA